MIKKLLVVTLAGSLLSAPAVATAQEDPVITYRQKVMQSMGANLGGISDILKFSLPHQANIQAHAEQINKAAGLIPSAFEANVSEGMTDAKPVIWEEWEEFQKYAEELESASQALVETGGGDTAAIGEAVKEVGGKCKQCHDEFRKPKEESYKQQ